METLEDEAQMRAALAGEVADLKERISHFKAMEETMKRPSCSPSAPPTK